MISIGRDETGRLVARCDDTLARFLNTDVPDADYADQLAAEAERGGPADLTGNAYAVTIGADGVLLTHLHVPGRPADALSRDEFAAVLRAWAGALRAG